MIMRVMLMMMITMRIMMMMNENNTKSEDDNRLTITTYYLSVKFAFILLWFRFQCFFLSITSTVTIYQLYSLYSANYVVSKYYHILLILINIIILMIIIIIIIMTIIIIIMIIIDGSYQCYFYSCQYVLFMILMDEMNRCASIL